MKAITAFALALSVVACGSPTSPTTQNVATFPTDPSATTTLAIELVSRDAVHAIPVELVLLPGAAVEPGTARLTEVMRVPDGASEFVQWHVLAGQNYAIKVNGTLLEQIRVTEDVYWLVSVPAFGKPCRMPCP